MKDEEAKLITFDKQVKVEYKSVYVAPSYRLKLQCLRLGVEQVPSVITQEGLRVKKVEEIPVKN